MTREERSEGAPTSRARIFFAAESRNWPPPTARSIAFSNFSLPIDIAGNHSVADALCKRMRAIKVAGLLAGTLYLLLPNPARNVKLRANGFARCAQTILRVRIVSAVARADRSRCARGQGCVCCASDGWR